MPKPLLIDVILVHIYVPARLPDAEATTVRQTLRGPRFMGRLRQAVQVVVGKYPSLANARFRLTR